MPEAQTRKISEKVCINCGGRKSLAEFYAHPSTKDRLFGECKSCVKKRNAAWNKANPEKHNKFKAAHQKRNPEAHRRHSRRSYHIATYGKEVPILEMSRDRYRVARSLGFRSGLEVQLAKQLDDNQVQYTYEGSTFKYEQPAEIKRHTPDFILPNFIIVEGKGEWTSSDRKKVKLFLQLNPGIDYRMVFSRSKSRISKKSKTTYADVCRTLGIKFADEWIPAEWWREPVNEVSKAAIEKALNAH
jgi:hypothetical protein